MAVIIVVILVIVMVGIVIKNLFCDGSRSRRTIGNEQQKKVKSQKKENKPVKKQDGPNIASKAKTKKSSVVSDTATVLAGAALAHQLRKHHKHDDISDIEDSYYDYERAAYEEEQAAYDDFIASNDMDND
jgi:mannitol-specific phosphotransferase system IIBC component